MVPWDTVTTQLVAFASWIAGLIGASIPILAGGLSALLGTYAGALLESNRQRTEIIREDVCRPIMNELEQVKGGDIPSQSVWNEVDAVSKQLLDEGIQRDLNDYTDILEEISELDDDISSFQLQLSQRYQDDRGIITTDSKNSLCVKVEEIGHPQDPYEHRFAECDLADFVAELPDVSKFYTNGHDPIQEVPEQFQEWASSEECEFDDLIRVWRTASSNWEAELKSLFSAPIGRYQENLEKRENKEKDLKKCARTIFSELEDILTQEYDLVARLLSTIS
jgi:hypothetical protein